jgi:hypothetical protein
MDQLILRLLEAAAELVGLARMRFLGNPETEVLVSFQASQVMRFITAVAVVAVNAPLLAQLEQVV